MSIGLALFRRAGTLAGMLALMALSACNFTGSSHKELLPPANLSYNSPASWTVGTAITPLNPTITGTTTSYYVSPAFPAGITLDATTGHISGTPTAGAATTTYTVSARNDSGATSFNLVATVNGGAPSALRYTTPKSYTVGTAITPLTPTVTGTVTTWSASPTLPAGLAISVSTGVISGTPTAAAAQASYTVTAANGGGSTQFILSITVVAPAPPLSGIKATAMVATVGAGTAIALREDGSVWAWGSGAGGFLGQNDINQADSPGVAVPVCGNGGCGSPLGNIVQVSANGQHALALTGGGGVLIWGTAASRIDTARGSLSSWLRPDGIIDTSGTGSLANIVAISAGSDADIALRSDGTVVTWGRNNNGQLGVGAATTASTLPVVVPGLAGIVAVAAGTDAMFAIRNDGVVYAWGINLSGALGNGSADGTIQYTPVQLAVSGIIRIASRGTRTLALATDGTIYGWGTLQTGTATGSTCPETTVVATPTAIAGVAGASTGIATSQVTGVLLRQGAAVQSGADLTGGNCQPTAGYATLPITNVLGAAGGSNNVMLWNTAGQVSDFAPGQPGGAPAVLANFSLFVATGAGTTVFTENFDGASVAPQFTLGSAAPESGQGYVGLGATGNKFAANILRSATGNTVTLTLTGLPAHTGISLDFLFAAIDSLDGTGAFPSGDFFKVTLDGATLMREAFANATPSQIQTYVAPPGGTLARRIDLGFGGPGSYFTDSAYDMSVEPAFHHIPHTASTATFTFVIEGAGIQALSDESWGMDNVKVTVY